ncbi:MAG: HAD family hydrolase [Lachnospiraceae bacterium]
MKKAVIFDLDGTLTDSLESIKVSADKAIGEFGFGPYTKEQYKYFVGDGADTLIERCLVAGGDKGLAYFDRAFVEYQKIFQEYCMYRVVPYDGIKELLAALKERGIKIAVLSNKPHERTKDVIYTLFGEGYFDVVQGQIAGMEKKPSPAGVFHILKQLELTAEDVLYLGDTGTDMQTGKSAGAVTIGALWGFREREELLENHADYVIEKPLELLQYV